MNSSRVALSMHPTRVSTLVTLAGEIDIANAHALDLRLSKVYEQRNKHLVIDCGALTFIDCCGTRSLVAVARAFRAMGGTVLLYRPPWSLMRILEISGQLDQFLIGGVTIPPEMESDVIETVQVQRAS
jgi:anti-sigma B factor antagonist